MSQGLRRLEGKSTEKELMVLADNVDVGQQCALVTVKANCILNCVSKNSHQIKKLHFALYLALVWLFLEDCSFCPSSARETGWS